MHFRIAMLLAIFALVAPARASDAPVHGGPGGQPFKFTCNDGSYLVGLKGFYGHWIDQISAVCAPWLPSKLTFGEAKTGISFGESKGMFPFSLRCPRAYVVQGIDMTFTFDDEHRPKHLDDIRLYCVTVAGPADYQSIDFESLSEDSTGHWISLTYGSACAAGEAATGIHGRSGLMVDAMGLVCGPAPQSPTAGALTGPGKQGTTLDRKILQPKSTLGKALGAAECTAGFVPRLARPTDDVCVMPDSHARVVQENATAASRRDPKGKSGPYSCIQGFVWREAFAGDLVCVTPQVRQLVRQENALASSRSVGPTQLMRP